MVVGVRERWLLLHRLFDLLDGLCAVRRRDSALGIVTIHPEQRDPEVCFLGMVGVVDRQRKRFELLQLSTAATWDGRPTGWRFRDVSRIDALTGYAAALGELAGPPPARSPAPG